MPGHTERHYAVALDGTRMTYECRAGHRYVVDHGRGPVARRLPEWWLRRMLSYWGRENGGVACPPCRRCRKAT
jgi:hypothetical protein